MKRWIPAVVVLAVLLGCGALTQLRARKLMVGTVFATPALTFTPPAGTGFTLQSKTQTTVFFGERARETYDEPPMPIEGATVTLSRNGTSPVTLDESGDGVYATDSGQDSTLQYVAGATYGFTLISEGQTYTAEIADAPPPENVGGLDESPVRLAAGSALTLTRPAPVEGQERALGFVSVYPISESGARGGPTYTNLPDTPLRFLQFVALPSEWKQTEVIIPGTAFPEANRLYLVVFQAGKIGEATSDNLMSLSALLAGTADLGVVQTF
jgi:hypothetical protein